MNRIQNCFAKAKGEGRGVFVAYLTMGYPSAEESAAAADALLANGADVLELGVPFSDPVADGAVIRAAAAEALKQGINLPKILGLAKEIRARHEEAPLVLFSYYNVIFSHGLKRFAEEAKAAGIDAVLAVDVPVEERGELLDELRAQGLTMVPLAAPTTPMARMAKICEGLEDSFLYAVTVKGVTGARAELPPDLGARLAEMRATVGLPVVAGFGVNTREHAEMLAKECEGFVVGSAIVKLLGEGGGVDKAAEFARRLTGRDGK